MAAFPSSGISIGNPRPSRTVAARSTRSGLVEVIWLAALEREDAEFAPGQVADGGEGRHPDDRPSIVPPIERRLGGEGERVSRVAQERAVFLQGVRDHFFPAWPGLRVDRERGVELDARALGDGGRIIRLTIRVRRGTGDVV